MAYMGCHMYNENDDEIIKPAKDVFEINDFTAATEWENFIDDIENIFRNWKLSQSRKRVKVSLCQQLASSLPRIIKLAGDLPQNRFVFENGWMGLVTYDNNYKRRNSQ